MEETTTKKRNPAPFILGAVAIVVGIVAFRSVSYNMHNEDTENAQVECDISPMSPKIQGFVEQVRFKENDYVHRGDTLLMIDNRDLLIRVHQAEAALASAEANVAVAQSTTTTATANVSVANADINTAVSNVEAAKVKVWQASQDFDRYSKLLGQGSITQQMYDNAKAAKETAEKQLESAQNAVHSSKDRAAATNTSVASTSENIKFALTNVELRRQELEMAKLQLSYSIITAPFDGYVSKKNVQPGQLVQPGQTLCSVVNEASMWVTANFKETQIERMKIGQKVKIQVDAYPGKDFEGHIESFSAATGSKFALLPPDNATGNFVKVVQRIPVKVVIDKSAKDESLRAGMNVKVVVKLS